MPKHDNIVSAEARLGKAETQPASSLSTGQVRKPAAGGSRVHHAPLRFVIQVGSQFLVSAADAQVTFGPKTEAWVFASRRSAWAFMGVENVPIDLLKQARIVISAELTATPEIAA
jgi:hypothetical protein